MAVAFRSNTPNANSTAATFSVTKPPGATNGDWLVAFQETALGGGSAPATPIGWTLLDRQTHNTTGNDIACFIKLVNGDGASYTFNNAGGLPFGNYAQVNILCWSGAGTPTQISKNSGSSASWTASGITTAADGSYLQAGWGIDVNVNTAVSLPGGWTNLGNTGNATCRLYTAYVSQPTAGASGDKTASADSQAYGALMVVIPPAVAAPVAAFSGTPLTGGAPLSVTFTDASTNTPTSWLWEKNSGSGWVNFASTPTAQNPTESFAAGTWSVRLTATNAAGSDAEEKTNYLVSTTSPVAAFSGTPLSGTDPLSVAFTDASTNSPTSWLWQKNDGSGYVNFSSGHTSQNPTESFTEGVWDVKLTATNAGGSDPEEKLDYVTVTAPSAGGGSGAPLNTILSRRRFGGSVLRRRIGRRL